MGLFGAAHEWAAGGAEKVLLLKIYYVYPTMIKFDTVIPYLKKIQKYYKSLVTSLSFAGMSIIHQKLEI